MIESRNYQNLLHVYVHVSVMYFSNVDILIYCWSNLASLVLYDTLMNNRLNENNTMNCFLYLKRFINIIKVKHVYMRVYMYSVLVVGIYIAQNIVMLRIGTYRLICFS